MQIKRKLTKTHPDFNYNGENSCKQNITKERGEIYSRHKYTILKTIQSFLTSKCNNDPQTNAEQQSSRFFFLTQRSNYPLPS